MNEAKAKAALERLFRDAQPVTASFSKADLWILLSTVQLALRHPKYVGTSAKVVHALADQLAAPLIEHDPDLAALWARGKNPHFDVPWVATPDSHAE